MAKYDKEYVVKKLEQYTDIPGLTPNTTWNFGLELPHSVNPSPLGGFPDAMVMRPQGESNGESLLEFRLRMTTSI